MMTFSDAISILVASGFLSTGAAYYLYKRFLDIQVQKAVDKHKTDLERKTNALKSELDIYAHERTIGLTRLEELRATAIREIFAIVIEWQEAFLNITAPNLPKSPVPERQVQRLVNWSESLARIGDRLSIKVRDTSIYFDEESYAVVAHFGSVATDLGLDFRAATFDQWGKGKEMNVDEMIATFEPARQKLRTVYKDEGAVAQRLLVRDFRRLMKAERIESPKA